MCLILAVASPWEVTDNSRCHDVCDMNAYCAQLVPQLEYQCVCKAGYEGNGKSCGGRSHLQALLSTSLLILLIINHTKMFYSIHIIQQTKCLVRHFLYFITNYTKKTMLESPARKMYLQIGTKMLCTCAEQYLEFTAQHNHE